MSRATYEPIARDAARRAGIPENVFISLITEESNWNPAAYNPTSGASGIAQFLPSTARSLGIDPWNPTEALYAAARYLAQRVQQHGSLQMGLAGYQGFLNPDGTPKPNTPMAKYNQWVAGQDVVTPQQQDVPDVPYIGPYSPAFYKELARQRTEDEWFEVMADPNLLRMVLEAYAVTGTPLPTTLPDWVQQLGRGIAAERQRLLAEEGQPGSPSLGDYVNTIINSIGTDIEARRLTLDQGVKEFERRLSAFREASASMRDMMPWTVPLGAKYVPGREPGGLGERVGLAPVPATPVMFNPFQMARDIVAGTPRLTDIGAPAVPSSEDLFRRALVQSRTLAASYVPPPPVSYVPPPAVSYAPPPAPPAPPVVPPSFAQTPVAPVSPLYRMVTEVQAAHPGMSRQEAERLVMQFFNRLRPPAPVPAPTPSSAAVPTATPVPLRR